MLELRHVSKTFNPGTINEKKALTDLSLHLAPGEFVTVIGGNGAGKSTLLNAVAGVWPVDSGRILLDGEDITALSVTERAKRGISFAFQQPVRFKGLRVLDLLRLAAGRDISPADACEYLAAVGLCARDYIQREVNASLSGGELKRVEIATVLARGTALSVFDEPEAGIDLWSFQNLIEVFEGMRKNIHDSSIMIISHQERILNIADEIVVLKDGRVDRQGPKDEILPELIGTPAAVAGCRKTAREVRA